MQKDVDVINATFCRKSGMFEMYSILSCLALEL